MKTLIWLLIFGVSLLADAKKEMFNLYQNEQYTQACSYGLKEFSAYRKDEEFLSLYAFSCLHADYINRLALPIAMLKRSKEARSNATYLSIIVMQKKMLYHALIDGYDISQLKLPTTDYVLSKVFDLYAKDDHSQKRTVYLYRDSASPKVTYKLYISRKSSIKKMVIEEYYDTILAHRHVYW